MSLTNINELNNLLQESYPSLSKKMKLIAFYIVDQPQNLAINTLAVIADDIGVYPSTLVRFAKHFGFSGFAQLQSLFKVRIAQSTINYQLHLGHLQYGTSFQGYLTYSKNNWLLVGLYLYRILLLQLLRIRPILILPSNQCQCFQQAAE